MMYETDSKSIIKNNKLNPAFWNGLFICLSVILLWWGYNYIRGARIDEGFTIKVKFEDILGLSKGNDVIYAGLVIGEVSAVGRIGGVNSTDIIPLVTLNIKEEYDELLYKDALFTIKSPLFVGDYWVEIVRGPIKSKERLMDGAIVSGAAELNPSKLPEEIQRGIGPILINLKAFTDEIARLVENGKVIDDIRNTISSLSSTLEKTERVLQNIEPVEDGSKIEMDKIKEAFENLYRTSVKIDMRVQDLEQITDDAKDVLSKLNNGDGTFSKLINDPYLYNEYADIAKNANILIKDMKENPRKYIRWSDIIKGWREKD
ncbi:MAG: hypothetical protein CMG00_04560 [Candidatus Marinimicrobia bacterium]|nr:hypothetical protein [Candidatus Neomarinimicrobiota bacterium]